MANPLGADQRYTTKRSKDQQTNPECAFGLPERRRPFSLLLRWKLLKSESQASLTDDYTETLVAVSRERQIHVSNRLVDLLRVLETDRGAIHSRVLEGEPHGFHAIVVTPLELTATAELHANHT